MGILGNAINQTVNGIVGLGFRQLDDLITRKVQEGKLEEAALLAEQADRETVDKQQMLFNLVNPPTTPGLGGIVPGPIPRGAPDLSNPDIQAQISSARQIPKSFFELGSKGNTGILGQQAVNRNQNFISNDPFIAAQKEIQRQQGKAFDTRAGVIGELGKDRNIGTEEINSLVSGQTELGRREQLDRSNEQIFEDSESRASGRDVVAQIREQRAEARKGKNKPTRLKDFEIKRIKDEFLANPDFSENDVQKEGKRKLTRKGNKAFRLAVKRAEEDGISPLSAVSETETQTSKNKALSRRANKLQGGNPIQAVRRIAPGSPRFAEVQQDIEEAKARKWSNGRIRALLIKDGVSPEGFGF